MFRQKFTKIFFGESYDPINKGLVYFLITAFIVPFSTLYPRTTSLAGLLSHFTF